MTDFTHDQYRGFQNAVRMSMSFLPLLAAALPVSDDVKKIIAKIGVWIEAGFTAVADGSDALAGISDALQEVNAELQQIRDENGDSVPPEAWAALRAAIDANSDRIAELTK